MENERIRMDRIQKIKKIKVRKRTSIIIITIVVVLLTFMVLLSLDKNANIFDGNLAKTFMMEKNQEVGKDAKQEEKNKKQAIKVAKKKFEELGEKVEDKDLEVLKIQRKGELYYYISAKENTVEVRISDNKITRVNSIPEE